MWSTNPRGGENIRTGAIFLRFEIIENFIEPPVINSSGHLFAENNRRPALANEIEGDGPQVSFVSGPKSFASA